MQLRSITLPVCCPRVAIHVLWDFPSGVDDAIATARHASELEIEIGSINPNLFEDQGYKFGSLGNEDRQVRRKALDHVLECIDIGKRIGSRDLSLWFADGSNYPGTANMRRRRTWFEEGLRIVHDHLDEEQRLLLEYKPFEPAFYHTDIADWGMALALSRAAGPRARVLVDTGHHYASQNIEQIVAWLLQDEMLGGFHFNDRRYADDDLTLGSIDPYQVFRIFYEMHSYQWETGLPPDVAYMIDQSHNLKNKIEAMIQTVVTAQELYLKAALVDHDFLEECRRSHALIDAEECLKQAFGTDVSPILADWRKERGRPEDPLKAFRRSGYVERILSERESRNRKGTSSYI